jgi:hypothetical protein
MESRYELTFTVQVTSPSMLIICHVQSEDFGKCFYQKRVDTNTFLK